EANLFLVTSYDLINEILKDTGVFSSNFSTIRAGSKKKDKEMEENLCSRLASNEHPAHSRPARTRAIPSASE
ncbi:hypothetical protein RRG12_42700, partial [Nostoc sp. CALU 546]